MELLSEFEQLQNHTFYYIIYVLVWTNVDVLFKLVSFVNQILYVRVSVHFH